MCKGDDRLLIRLTEDATDPLGGFQLDFLSTSWVINHMTCYELECSYWWKIYFSKKSVTVESGINVAPGTFGKNNKHCPLNKRSPISNNR